MKLDFRKAEIFRGTQILRQASDLAYAYETAHAAADADGAPNAYHPDDLHKNCQKDPHVGLDCLANAGYPNSSWWRHVLVPDPNDDSDSKAFAQQGGPFTGYFVAMTVLRKPGGSKYDPATYVDSTNFPYVVIPMGFEKLPHVAGQGDVGFATHLASGRTAAFIVADAGGGADAKLGEGSLALYQALGFPNVNPRTGHGLPHDRIQYILFPNSRKPAAAIWPRTNVDIHDQVVHLLKTTPGISATNERNNQWPNRAPRCGIKRPESPEPRSRARGTPVATENNLEGRNEASCCATVVFAMFTTMPRRRQRRFSKPIHRSCLQAVAGT